MGGGSQSGEAAHTRRRPVSRAQTKGGRPPGSNPVRRRARSAAPDRAARQDTLGSANGCSFAERLRAAGIRDRTIGNNESSPVLHRSDTKIVPLGTAVPAPNRVPDRVGEAGLADFVRNAGLTDPVGKRRPETVRNAGDLESAEQHREGIVVEHDPPMDGKTRLQSPDRRRALSRSG